MATKNQTRKITIPEDKITLAQKIGHILMVKRTESRMSQGDVSELIYGNRGSTGHLSKVERGLKNVTIETISLYLKAVGAKEEDIFNF